MAIDRKKMKGFLDEIDELFDDLSKDLPFGTSTVIKKYLLGPAFKEIRELIDESRPPKLMMVGRSGHGKSSLINTLAKKKVAKIDDTRPCSPETEPHEIPFEDKYASWSVIDTRGIFETTRPEGASTKDPVEVLKDSIIENKPDLIFHVISILESRGLSNDLEVLKKIREEVKKKTKLEIPTVIVLNKVDHIEDIMDWPPENHSLKVSKIKKQLDYMCEVLNLEAKEVEYIDPATCLRGYKIKDDTYVGVIPVNCIENRIWNIDVLSYFIGEYLPENALLDFFQARNENELLKKLSTSIIKRFSAIAGTIGAIPIGILPDIILITPLQLLMISIIAALSGRELKKETAIEFVAAMGVNVGAGIGFKQLAKQLTKLIPILGLPISGAIAHSATYAIGKSAEAYFFNGEKKKPEEFME